MKTQKALEVTFSMKVEQDQLELRGNCSTTGDELADRECEENIVSELEQGNVWAWAWVEITASVEVDGEVFEGRDSLGGCSYASEADFKKDAYYADMQAQAMEDLRNNIKAAVKRGTIARRTLALIP
jgi:hypothetical protein